MTLREELEEILTNEIEGDPLWAELREERTILSVSGSGEEVLQTVTAALMTYSDALLQMTLRLADAIDDLSGNAGVEDDG